MHLGCPRIRQARLGNSTAPKFLPSQDFLRRKTHSSSPICCVPRFVVFWWGFVAAKIPQRVHFIYPLSLSMLITSPFGVPFYAAILTIVSFYSTLLQILILLCEMIGRNTNSCCCQSWIMARCTIQTAPTLKVLLFWSTLAILQVRHYFSTAAFVGEKLFVKSTHESTIEAEILSPIYAAMEKLEVFHRRHKSKCIHHSHQFNHIFVRHQTDLVRLHKMTLVNESRLNATLWLAKAAMHLPGGDFVETGMWLGGSAAVMIHSIMKFDTCGRHFWGFDSFEGLPSPSVQDLTGNLIVGTKGDFNISMDATLAKLEEVKALGTNVHVVKGWFNVTCPASPVVAISLLRMDGDLFESTWDTLVALYDKVMPGGFVYVDDYGGYNGCSIAVNKFRQEKGITEPMHVVPDGVGLFYAVWWQKR